MIMTRDNKELLLKDLCGRLPYGVKGNYQNSDDELLRKVTIMYSYLEPNGMVMTGDIKPYLFPLSSMSTSERNEIVDLLGCDFPWSISEGKLTWAVGGSVESELFELTIGQLERIMHIFNSRHYDYRGLIEKHLANDATGLGIYKQE